MTETQMILRELTSLFLFSNLIGTGLVASGVDLHKNVLIFFLAFFIIFFSAAI